MKFEETNKNIITIPKYENCFIYFLLKDNEVVYVGQTKHGIIRPLTHTKDKDFNEIKILYCEEKELDLTEDCYIQKYKPLYNKQNNYAVRYSLLRVRDIVRRQFNQPKYTIPRLKKVLKLLNIETDRDYYTRKETISFNDYKRVIEHIRGADYEIHNRGV